MASTAGAAATGAPQPQGQPRNDSRGRGGGRGRGRGKGRGGRGARGGQGRGGAAGLEMAAPSAPATAPDAPVDTTRPLPNVGGDGGEDARSVAGTDPDVEMCFICANPVVHYAVAGCNHKTCHICALRMRALYKTKDCAHCRTPAPYVIFTDNPEKPFDEYSPADISSTDDNIGVRYTNEDIVGDTVLLLRYNCPDSSCDFAGLGWPDLHRHVKSTHHKRMCDLCTRNKRVFTHEHELFQDRELDKHMKRGDDRPGAVDQTGFKGHPLCGFCGERFYDDDKLYEHCRNKHERCFVCDRQNPRQPHYFRNYDALESHFRKDHFLCMDRECLEKKFVVFASEIDLKAHQLSEHGTSLSKDVRRDARVVDIAGFDYRQPYQQDRRGGGGGPSDRDGGGRGRGRGRDPGAEPLPASSAQPMRRDELAFQRQLAIHSTQSVSNRNFGSQLSAAPAAPAAAAARGPTPAGAARQTARQAAAAGPSPSSSSPSSTPIFPLEGQPDRGGGSPSADAASLSPQDRARLVRHRAVIERAQGLLGNDAARMARFRSDVSAFKNGRLDGPKFLDALFTLFSASSSNSLGVLVQELADIFEAPGRADALRKAWQDWRAINEDYPSLPGLGGMHGATTASSGWASAASPSPARPAPGPAVGQQKHSTRVLKLKSSTRLGPTPVTAAAGSSSSGAASSWTAPARGATKPPQSSNFPALPSRAKGGSGSGGGAPKPSWVASATGAAQGGAKQAPRRTMPGEDAFPALPAAPRPQTSIFGYGRGSVRRDWGQTRDTGFSWGAEEEGQGQGQEQGAGEEEGGKKKKGKGKKVLVQWG